MGKNTSIALDDHFTEFLAVQVGSGRYGSASEVVRAGLRLLESHEARLADLREAIRVGDESGEVEGFDLDSFYADLRANPRG